MEIRQEPVSLEVGGVPLRGLAYAPATEPPGPRRGLVLCDPFAEEKKSAASTLSALARSLAAAGLWAWHFDYRGTGDSGGDFASYTLADWRQDLEVAFDFAQGKAMVGLLGLRLGATLAAEVAPNLLPWRLVLWEPVREGARYVRELRQRATLKRVLTDAEGPALSAPSSSEEEGLDHGGYLLTPRLLEELAALHLSPLAEVACPTLLVECNARGQVSPAAQTLVAEAPHVEARALSLEPFWQRVGLVNTSRLVELTGEWLLEGPSPPL